MACKIQNVLDIRDISYCFVIFLDLILRWKCVQFNFGLKLKFFFLWKFTIIYSFFYANMISKYVNRRVLIYLWKIDFRDWRSTKVYLLNYKQLKFVVNEIKSRIVYPLCHHVQFYIYWLCERDT